APVHTPTANLFPYTTLFRSQYASRLLVQGNRHTGIAFRADSALPRTLTYRDNTCDTGSDAFMYCAVKDHETESKRFYFLSNIVRSEEHTSELQSRENLVCRL